MANCVLFEWYGTISDLDSIEKHCWVELRGVFGNIYRFLFQSNWSYSIYEPSVNFVHSIMTWGNVHNANSEWPIKGPDSTERVLNGEFPQIPIMLRYNNNSYKSNYKWL